METLVSPSRPAATLQQSRQFFLSRFITWCASQEQNRLGWLTIIIAAHACLITPMTLLTLVFSGNHMSYWVTAIAAIVISLVTNLAALPTKITIPAFAFSILLDLYVIISCLVQSG